MASAAAAEPAPAAGAGAPPAKAICLIDASSVSASLPAGNFPACRT
jgi:hypothetical protein